MKNLQKTSTAVTMLIGFVLQTVTAYAVDAVLPSKGSELTDSKPAMTARDQEEAQRQIESLIQRKSQELSALRKENKDKEHKGKKGKDQPISEPFSAHAATQSDNTVTELDDWVRDPAGLRLALHNLIFNKNVGYGEDFTGATEDGKDHSGVTEDEIDGYIGGLFDIVGDPNYVFDDGDPSDVDTYSEVFLLAAALYVALQEAANEAKRQAVNNLFATNFPASGSPATVDLDDLFGIAGTPGYNQEKFLNAVEGVSNFYDALKADPVKRDDYNVVFGANVSDTEPLSGVDRGKLFDTAAPAEFNQEAFFAVLPKVRHLLDVLRGDTSLREAYNRVFFTIVSASGSLVGAARKSLFDTAGDPNYVEVNFVAALPKVDAFWAALKADAVKRSDFNTVFGTSISASGQLSGPDRAELFGVVSPTDFDQDAFFALLPKVVSLLIKLQGNEDLLSAYNMVFEADVPASGSPGGAARKSLFDAAGDPNYDEAKILAALPNAKALLTALIGDTIKRDQFNYLYETGITETVVGAEGRTALMGVVSGSGYEQVAYLTILPLTHELATEVIRASQAKLDRFNKIFGEAEIALSGKLTVAQLTLLFGIAGDPKYNRGAFERTLANAYYVLQALQGNLAKLAKYNKLYKKTPLPASGPILSIKSRIKLMKICGAKNFDADVFLAKL